MILFFDSVIIPNKDFPLEISLRSHKATVHRGVVEGLVPISIWSKEEAIAGVVQSVVKSCMRQHCADHKTAPWEKVIQRLDKYQLDHRAHLHSDHIDVQIFPSIVVEA